MSVNFELSVKHLKPAYRSWDAASLWHTSLTHLIPRFRAKGPNVHRKMDLDQRPRGPIGNKDDPYFDPNEDPSYEFKFNTRTYSKNENADARGDVKGTIRLLKYNYNFRQYF